MRSGSADGMGMIYTRKKNLPSKYELSSVIGGINESLGSTVGAILESCGALARH